MQSDYRLNNAVLIYFVLLFLFVIADIVKSINIFDLVYLVALVCSILKYVFVIHGVRR